jgi:hypothetical protein
MLMMSSAARALVHIGPRGESPAPEHTAPSTDPVSSARASTALDTLLQERGGRQRSGPLFWRSNRGHYDACPANIRNQ